MSIFLVCRKVLPWNPWIWWHKTINLIKPYITGCSFCCRCSARILFCSCPLQLGALLFAAPWNSIQIWTSKCCVVLVTILWQKCFHWIFVFHVEWFLWSWIFNTRWERPYHCSYRTRVMCLPQPWKCSLIDLFWQFINRAKIMKL